MMDVINLGFVVIPLEDIGYLAIYLIMVIDGANVPFTPNELFLALTGYLARTGELNSVAAYSVGFLGSFTGHLISFVLGWKIGKPLLTKYGKFIALGKERIEGADQRVRRYGTAAPFIVRFIPGLRNMGSLILGILKFPYGPFVLLTAAGIAVYNALFFLTGFILAEQFTEFKEIIFALVIFITALGLSLAAFSWYKTKKNL